MPLKLYKAALRGDWDDWRTAHEQFNKRNPGMTTIITDASETALHLAVYTGRANEFVKKMAELMPPEDLALEDFSGDTALHNAAVVGNTEAAMLMIENNPDLPHILNKSNQLAVLKAAEYCHKETLEFLISKSNPNAFQGQFGVRLLNAVIASEIYDVALELVYKYPHLAQLTDDRDHSHALSTLASIPSAFPSRESLSWWQSLIYSCIPIQKSEREASQAIHVTGDIESTGGDAQTNRNGSIWFPIISGVKQKLASVLWKIIQYIIVPSVNKKAAHQQQQALELVKHLCDKIITLPEREASSMLETAMHVAASHGVSEVVEVIMEMHPNIIWNTVGETGGSIFHVAAMNRFENVFSLIYGMTDRKHILYDYTDNEDNNLMHLCGKLAPAHKLNLVPGAALQMQRELHWFKEMENFVRPSRRTRPNKNGQTPNMVFTSEHQQLKADGERWMKDTASACTLPAALIATVMFTAAFNVPGGISSNGVPILVKQHIFTLFAISDAVSLFTSVTSLLMFLSILTSRYAEQDFLYVLPKRLIIGLLSLFISITSMLVAFCAAMYLVFRERHPGHILPVVVSLAGLLIASFVVLQFGLLVDVIHSTYFPGIFRKKTNRVFY